MKRSLFCLFTIALAYVNAVTADTLIAQETYSLYDYVNKTQNYSNSITPSESNFNIVIDGKEISVGITGWSDTGSSNDNLLEQGTLDGWYNCDINRSYCTTQNRKYGYGLQNVESGDSHSIDNYSGGKDFDMFLLSFDTAVSIQGAGFSWKNNSSDKEVTVVGLNDFSGFGSDSSLTWASVAGNVVDNTIGHFSTKFNSSVGLYESKFKGITQTATYWLVGAYNTYFDTPSSQHEGVGLKLSTHDIAVHKQKTTQTPTQVSEPGALALMGLGLGLVLYRRKRRV